MNLSDLERRNARGQSDLRQLRLCGLTYNDYIWHDKTSEVIKKRVSKGVSHAPIPRGGVPASPKFVEPSTFAQTIWHRAT